MATHWIVSLSAFGSKGIFLLTRFFSVPFLIHYLGVESYAIFATFLSLEGWFLLLDLGVGTSLQNFLSESRAEEMGGASHIASAKLFSLIILPIFSLFLILFHSPLEKAILGTSENLFLLPGIFFLISGIGMVGYKALYAFHRGYVVHILQGLSGILSFAFLLILSRIYQGEAKLYYCSLIWTFFPALFASFVLIYVFRKGKNKPAHFGSLLSRAGKFFVFQFWGALILLVDYFIMLKTLSADSIVAYNVFSKIFSTSFFLYNSLLLGFWPHASEWMHQRRFAKVLKGMGQNMVFGFAIIMGTLVGIVLFLPFIKHYFMLSVVSMQTLMLFGIYFLIRVFCDAFGVLMQSISMMRVFLYFLPFQAAISIGGQLILSKWLGVDGILLGLIFSYLLTVCWILPLAFAKQKRQPS